MITFSNKKIFNSQFLILILIFLFSFFINFYYSKFGTFPIDTFLHYDTGFRILNNEFPVRDYWIVSGFIVDFLQAIFFQIFGVNWFAYTFHSSLFNFIISLFSYYFFLSLNINRIKSLIYTLSFATLAYTISGTPFVDHHSVFFLLIATYLIITALKHPKKNYLWVLIVIMFFFSFLSKQVPTFYVALSQGAIILFILIKKKNFYIFKIISISFIASTIFFLFLLTYLNIDISLFYTQYLDYPRTIGFERYDKFSKSFEIFYNQYKFLFLPIIIIIILKLKKIQNKKINFASEEIINFLIIFVFGMSLLFHQIMTRNQIFIYFLIPIFFALLEHELTDFNFKYKKHLSIFLIFLIVFISFKYHQRFNETRKFHELERTNLDNAVSAKQIDESLEGLFWINPLFKGKPKEEIQLLKKAIARIDKTSYEIMLITHYLFLDSVTKKNLNYPNRTFTLDGASVPLKNNKLYKRYKRFLLNKMQLLDIKEIYFIKNENIPTRIITDYIDKNCHTLKEDDIFYIFRIKCLK